MTVTGPRISCATRLNRLLSGWRVTPASSARRQGGFHAGCRPLSTAAHPEWCRLSTLMWAEGELFERRVAPSTAPAPRVAVCELHGVQRCLMKERIEPARLRGRHHENRRGR